MLFLLLQFGCAKESIDFEQLAREKAYNFSSNYFMLLAQNNIEEACLYIVKNSGVIRTKQNDCSDSTAIIFNIIENLGPYIDNQKDGSARTYKEEDTPEKREYGEARQKFSVDYEYGLLSESISVRVDDNGEAHIQNYCFLKTDMNILADFLPSTNLESYCY